MSEDDKLKYQHGDPRPATELPAGIIISPDTLRIERVPPGQSRTRKWPVLQFGFIPQIAKENWSLDVIGLVEEPLHFDWPGFQLLPRVKVYADFHCVTAWSRLDNVWEGVLARDLIARARPTSEARFVVLKGYDSGWTTNLPLADFMTEDVLLADTHDGLPLTFDHGGPLRAMVPRLYAWKSAKWLRSIELTAENRPGSWEREGYHDRGDPWKEERFGP